MTAIQARQELKKFSRPFFVPSLLKFYRTAKGEYGEGDQFYGVRVPETRSVAKKFSHLELKQVTNLLQSKIHEERLLALIILVNQYKKADEIKKKAIYSLYMKNLKYVNNWNLVDVSAHAIVGAYLFEKARTPLFKLARSSQLWKKRVAMISTFYFIRQKDFKDSLKIAEILLHDEHDLIHKAVGWMLREIGHRDLKTEEAFLKKHYRFMPRTALRYAIEKLPLTQRQKYLKGEI